MWVVHFSEQRIEWLFFPYCEIFHVFVSCYRSLYHFITPGLIYVLTKWAFPFHFILWLCDYLLVIIFYCCSNKLSQNNMDIFSELDFLEARSLKSISLGWTSGGSRGQNVSSPFSVSRDLLNFSNSLAHDPFLHVSKPNNFKYLSLCWGCHIIFSLLQ